MEGGTEITIRALKRLDMIHRALALNPSMADFVTKFKLAVPIASYHRPTRTEEGDPDDQRVMLRLPEMWDENILQRVFLRMNRLLDLHLVFLWIPPRLPCVPATREAPMTFKSVPLPLAKTHLPPSVTHLCIEQTGDGVKSCDPWNISEGPHSDPAHFDLIDRNMTNRFTGFDAVEHLHIKVVSYKKPQMDYVKHFVGIRSVRLDHCTLGYFGMQDIRTLSRHFRPMHQLRILELRFSPDSWGLSFKPDWLQLWNANMTIRIPFYLFPAALENSQPERGVTFEVLFSSAVFEELPSVYADGNGVGDGKGYDEALEGMCYVAGLVEDVGAIFDLRRMRGLQEHRVVRAVPCEWDELYMDDPWFDDDEECDRFCSALHEICDEGIE